MSFLFDVDSVRNSEQFVYKHAISTPLVRLHSLAADDASEIYVKLENLQPTGAFKSRGAASVMYRLEADKLREGVCVASAGNMAQGVAWIARDLGVRCTVVAPDTAPETKLAAIRRLGADVKVVTTDEWWTAFRNRRHLGSTGYFVHAFDDIDVMRGNATIALEVLSACPDVDAILVPWGGGGLACGVATAVRQLRPQCRVIVCEVATAAPFHASFQQGSVATVDATASFVDGIGSKTCFENMFARSRSLVDDALVATVDETAAAVRVLAARNRVIAEGAGAVPVACALRHARTLGRKVVCVVSGGNIDADKLAAILQSDRSHY